VNGSGLARRSGGPRVATQGAIVTFVVLVLVYVQLMNGLDRRYGVYED
jgi:putative solute:sodium symporter small subunit